MLLTPLSPPRYSSSAYPPKGPTLRHKIFRFLYTDSVLPGALRLIANDSIETPSLALEDVPHAPEPDNYYLLANNIELSYIAKLLARIHGAWGLTEVSDRLFFVFCFFFAQTHRGKTQMERFDSFCGFSEVGLLFRCIFDGERLREIERD